MIQKTGFLIVTVFGIVLFALGAFVFAPSTAVPGVQAQGDPSLPIGLGVTTLAMPQTVVINVPGTSNPWLAGMPNGSTASSGDDVAPTHSPVEVTGLPVVPGKSLTFLTTGSVHYGPVLPIPSDPPDGRLIGFFGHGSGVLGVENGIANVIAQYNSLIGVFLDDSQPDSPPAPSALDFSPSGNVSGGIDFLTLSPVLKQPFFIGDGEAFGTMQQEVVVPVGAKRLFLGTFDGSGWWNNSGEFIVIIDVADNLAPISSNVQTNPNPVEVNSPITLNANVDDSTTGGSNIVSAEYNVDGASFNAMLATNGPFDEVSENVSINIASIPDPNVIEICVRGTDDAGNIGLEECMFLAIYDPDGGFVTGGGWINSPAGAYIPDPTLTGKANFGFVAKYKKGQSIPTGNTEFNFKAGDMNFHSDSYEWLVVTGQPKAMYKGTGTINGSGNYGFQLNAIDAEETNNPSDEDTFRIKIWDKDNGDAVVYDNQMGADENDDPTTTLGGGNIVIHDKKNKSLFVGLGDNADTIFLPFFGAGIE